MPSSPCKYPLAKGYASTSAKDSARSTAPDENNEFINYNAGPFNYNTGAINYNAGINHNTGAMNG